MSTTHEYVHVRKYDCNTNTNILNVEVIESYS